ncbi:HTH domain-containing protein [Caulobacter soli]|uniref:HTH domain-containing protein n=1 Tax=Caulobacter soli TaxID=2708539 RepID=UPI0013EA26F1|nr:HTH domain-containing protein [Caulobacter soli]
MRDLARGVPTRSLLTLLARLEGAPWPTGEQLAAALGVSRKAAANAMALLRQSGVLRTEMLTRPGEDACECVAYVRGRMVDAAALGEFEGRLTRDRSVMVVAQIAGAHDYRIEAVHPDVATAQAWFRSLLTDKAVGQGELRFTRTVLRRIATAAAILGSKPGGDPEA